MSAGLEDLVMKPLTVVIAQGDQQAAQQLAASLNQHFRAVHLATSADEVRHAIPKNRADLAIVDLELMSVAEVQDLRREYHHTNVICTHRVPDEEMWARALDAGALDCCHSSDVRSIVLAATRNFAVAHAA